MRDGLRPHEGPARAHVLRAEGLRPHSSANDARSTLAGWIVQLLAALKCTRPQPAIFHPVAGETRFALCVPLSQGRTSPVSLSGVTEGSAGRATAGHRSVVVGPAGSEGLRPRPRTDRHRNQHQRRKHGAPAMARSDNRFIFTQPHYLRPHRSAIEEGHGASPFMLVRVIMTDPGRAAGRGAVHCRLAGAYSTQQHLSWRSCRRPVSVCPA
jgi:hypothetical protein